MPKLMIDEGGQASVFELFEDEITIGRGASNAIQVVDGHASKNHAVIRSIGGRSKLVDLESKNGTKVNGEFKNQRWLEHGDTVTIGAAVLTFDGSDVGPAAPSVRGAAAGRAAPARPAPVAIAAGYAAAPAPSRAPARKSSRRRDDDYDDDEEGPRRPAPRGTNSAMIGMAVGAGVLALIAVLFVLLSNLGGTGKNASALQQAKIMHRRGDTEGALKYLRANSDPSDEDTYKSVKEQIDNWQNQLAGAGEADRGTEALNIYRKIEFDWIEKYKNKYTDEAWRARLKDFVTKYRGTTAVMEFLGSPFGYYPKMRDFIGEQKAWEALKALRDDWANRKEKRITDSEMGAKILKFQSENQGTFELEEMLTSANDPYPDFRRLIGAK